MHDIRAIRDDAAAFVRGWASRGADDAQATVDALLDLDKRLRAAQTGFQEAQSRRNEASKLIGQAKAKKDEAEAQRLMAEVEQLKPAMAIETDIEKAAGEELRALLSSLPNLPAEGVPQGADEHGNAERHVVLGGVDGGG